MNLLSLLSILIPASVCCLLIVTANQDDQRRTPFFRSRALLLSVIGGLFVFALTLLPYTLLTPEQRTVMGSASDSFANAAPRDALIAFAVAAISTGLALVVAGAPQSRLLMRQWIGRVASFDPSSTVHTVAVVLSIALIATNLSQLILSGGVAGLAEQMDQGSDELVINVLLQQVLWIVPSLLGVGWLTRRRWREIIDRLGLRLPTAEDIVVGIGVAIAMLVFVFVLSFAWMFMTSPETLEDQTAASAALSDAINTLPIAFLISVAVAFGEEIFFRGALQPVFGVSVTSLFFTILHTQYTLTPASAAILVLSVALGWVRRRYSTTAAIITHLVYNFAQLALAIFASRLLEGM